MLLHAMDGTSADPVGELEVLNTKLDVDTVLGWLLQVVVLIKIDVSKVYEREKQLLTQLWAVAGHSRLIAILVTTTWNG